MKPNEFKKGMKVIYIPTHADGNINHSDVEFGVVSSTNNTYVFVKYNNKNIINLHSTSPIIIKEPIIVKKSGPR